MTIHFFKTDTVTSVSNACFSQGDTIEKFTGDQTKITLYTHILEGLRSVKGRAIQIGLDRASIEFITTSLLRTPYWRDRLGLMVQTANQVAKQPHATSSMLRWAIQDTLDEADFGHTVCRAYGCHHKGHPERDPKVNVRDN